MAEPERGVEEAIEGEAEGWVVVEVYSLPNLSTEATPAASRYFLAPSLFPKDLNREPLTPIASGAAINQLSNIPVCLPLEIA